MILSIVGRVDARRLTYPLAALLALTACGDGGESPGAANARVVATTTQVADLARNVAGDRAAVTGLLSTGSDPHDYEPRPSDVRAVVDADLVLKSGGDLDGWADQIVDSADGERRVVELADDVQTTRVPDGVVDPHWWQDPLNAGRAVRRIRSALVEADPGGRASYSRNARRYLAALQRLDEQIGACLRRIPPARRKLVTTHDALGYYAARYGLEVVGAAIPALTTEAQPSAGETARLVRQVREQRVRAIFPETGLDRRLEEAIADEAGVSVGGGLWADTLGASGSSGATYLEAMRHNTSVIAEALTGGERSCRWAASGRRRGSPRGG